MTFHRIAALALAALLLPLLAACGGGSGGAALAPTAAPAGEFTAINGSLSPGEKDAATHNREAGVAAPTPAPAATSAPAAEAPLPAGGGATLPAPTTVPADVSGAVPPVRQEQQQQPPLRAGEVDDNFE